MDEFPTIEPDEADDDSRIPFDKPRRQKQDGRPNAQPRPAGNAALMRLVFLVATLLMVIWAMRVSGRAETWHWLFREDSRSAANARQPFSADPGGDSFVPAIPNQQVPESGDRANAESNQTDIDNTDVENSDVAPDLAELAAATDYELEFLRRFLKSLSGQDQIRFYTIVEHTAWQTGLPAGETAVAASLIRSVKQRWKTWKAKWETTAEEIDLGPSRRQQMADANRRWDDSILPAMDALLVQADVSRVDESLGAFRRSVRVAADSLVSQSTQVGRPVESYAWFAAWSDVFDQPLSMDADELPSPTITQLLGQPEFWTGQNLAIRGTALRVQRARAGTNPLGIQEYHVIWIRPDHVSSFPFCLYTLMPPESLVLAANEIERNVEVPVTATARLFKVRLFDGGGQAAQAPLLLASMVKIEAEPTAVNPSTPKQVPGPWLIGGVVILLAGIATWLARLAYRTSLSGRARGIPSRDRMNTAMQELQDDPNVETLQDKLKRMGSGHGE